MSFFLPRRVKWLQKSRVTYIIYSGALTKTNQMKKANYILCAVIAIMFAVSPATLYAQTKRALLIGVDIYQPPNADEVQKTRGGWTNLDGCVNDAQAIGEIIKGRFGFDEKNISTLFNQDARREKILAAMETLIAQSEKGDIVFIYYAGHGSQVNNSLSAEVSGDKKDESIVPADMFDIRDKELAGIFNRLLDKGVVLTLIFDSCHSGSIARGSSSPVIAKDRHMPANPSDAKDPSDPQKPEDRGALIFSAAQPEQLAKEALDDQGNPHGAFTVALIKALNSSSVNEPADILFLRLKAIMQANGNTQEPVLGGNETRRKQGLFGEDLSKNAGKTVVAVLKNSGTDNIELQGGWAIGLNTGCELKKMGANAGEVISITQVSGMAKCKAILKSGDINNIKPGDLFEISKWASGNKPNLKVWYPATTLTSDQIQDVAKNLGALATNKNYKWITDPTQELPDYIIQFYQDSWRISGPGGKLEDLGKNPGAETVIKKIPKNSSVFLQLPPSTELAAALKLGSGSDNSAIEVTANATQADYLLVGTFVNSVVQYAWLRPGISVSDSAFLSTLPLHTDWFQVTQKEDVTTVAAKLTQYALRLGKVNAWLNLSSPPDDGSYPFNLALKNAKTGEYLTAGTVTEGEQYSLVLQTDADRLNKWTGKSRYVYVFTIDIKGRTQQIFPFQNTGNEGNKLPAKNYELQNEISLGQVTFTISEPFGVDSYFLITSDEAINNFQAFNSEGVVTRGGGDGSPLENLINEVGVATRGITPNTTPANWSFQRIAITSKPINH